MKIITYLKKDWTMIPLGILFIAGYLRSFIDYNSVQSVDFHLFWKVLGFVLLVVGGFIEIKVRGELIGKAKFPGFQSTKLLQIVKDHQLITNGMFKYVRHPLYIGRIMLSFGIPMIFSSFYGLILIAIGVLFIFPRIQIEEEMLLKKFGDAYKNYQKTTKKLIPFIY